MVKTICFTGRRPKYLCGYTSHDAYKPFVAELKEIIRAYYNKGYRRFISGGAQGFDQLAFWTVENLKRELPDIENIVYVPFAGYGEHWVEEGVFGRNEYKLMLSRADKVHYCIPNPVTGRGEVNRALMNRNHAMVDNSNLVIALFPEPDFFIQRGGTAECMKYAVLNKRLPLLHIKYETSDGYLKIRETQQYGAELWAQGSPADKTHTPDEIRGVIEDIKWEYISAKADNATPIDALDAKFSKVIMRDIELVSGRTYTETEYRNIIATARRNCQSIM